MLLNIFKKNKSLLLIALLHLVSILTNSSFSLYAKDRVIIADSNDVLAQSEKDLNNNTKDQYRGIIAKDINATKTNKAAEKPDNNDGNNNDNNIANNNIKIPNLELKIKDPTGNVGSFNGILDNQIGTIIVPQPSN